MQLSKRLQAVADLVTPGNRVADVGCDHAYTSIYLAQNSISPNIIAMDVNQGPIDRARDNIIKYGLEDRIEVRRSDGLEKLKEKEADTIIIAGMGGELTVQILTGKPKVLNTTYELILQPQSEIYKVRQMLSDHGFIISREDMVKEDGKYYFMMRAVPTGDVEHNKKHLLSTEEHEKYLLTKKEYKKYLLTTKEHFYFGKLLLEQKNPILKEYLLWDYEICKEILKALAAGQSENSSQRQEEIKDRMELIQIGLKYYDSMG